MDIQGDSEVILVGNVLSGFYSLNLNQGIRPGLYELSSPTYGIGNFTSPFDAVLPDPGSPVGVGRKVRSLANPLTSNRSGKFYFYNNAELFGTCHGYGRDSISYYSGYNFYNAFYYPGYFVPPYGENLSIFDANQDGYSNLNNGACANISVTEYNEQFGIVSVTSSDIELSTSFLADNIYSPIYSPAEACPPEVAVTNYYDEMNYAQILGTSVSMGAGTWYNGNPIPTSLDSTNIKINGRYVLSGDNNVPQNQFIIFQSGRPLPSYSSDNQENLLNNTLCLATIMETNVSAGRGTNGDQLIQSPDILFGGIGDQVVFPDGTDTAFYYWHFTFRENADSLPFSNNFNEINQDREISVQGPDQGTELFLPVLSSEEAYWANRQCPDVVDFLPWTFGASIYACPSKHFDVPYYASIRKFGFYGTRFLNTCNALNLTNTWNSVPNASELPQQDTPLELGPNIKEPDGIDAPGNWTFAFYDNLLNTASMEEKYSNMYALNQGFFLWANSQYIVQTDEYLNLSQYSGFNQAFSGLVNQFNNFFPGGITGFFNNQPIVTISGGLASTPVVVESGNFENILFTNNVYNTFFEQISSTVPSIAMPQWYVILNTYSAYVMDNQGNVNESFYNTLITGREQRVLTRYMENSIRGNPIDLYPLNTIPFAFDNASDYLTNTGWARAIATVGTTIVPSVNRRYFQGAYGNASQITGLMTLLNSLAFQDTTAFYPGFFNNLQCGQMIPTPFYTPVISGIIMDDLGRRFSPSGWLAAGFNEIGALRSNFSCFTPIFTQHPVPKLFCKIGQAPTFRANAVDYHSIPDDKMSLRYPEIVYWAYKLKLMDNNFQNLYPLKYKWFRVPINKYTSFLASGDFSLADWANGTGDWGCMEGDTNNCTMVHPMLSSPTGLLGSFDNYIFAKGAIKNLDDQYYYMCLVSGRFGIRISETSQLTIEDWLKFDVSFKNGMNATQPVTIVFSTVDVSGKSSSIEFNSINQDPYYGYQLDPYAIPECVIQQKVPPPNAGYGDVTAYRFVGPIGYVGATRSYAPDTLMDIRGVRGAWGKFIDYGALVQFASSLNQQQGDLLYGYHHLPICTNYSMANGQKGVQVTAMVGGNTVTHWTLPQQAVASTDSSSVGIKWQALANLGGLYPPITSSTFTPDPNGGVSTASPGYDTMNGGYGIGQWQWGNNLGAIKRFGFSSTVQSNDIVFMGAGSPPADQIPQTLIDSVKQKLISPNSLAGTNCGFTPNGLGRNMLYYLEAYGRFYEICDALKKKNVRNLSFICPGLRLTNSAIQYFWLGHPTNTYLERRPMYGPYAYQWRVRRHNRDRNGNGISEAFYSMGWGERYSLLYDAPAIYGLYVKFDASQDYQAFTNQITTARNQAFPNGIDDIATYKNNWFGVGGTEGTDRVYGNFYCPPNGNTPLCNYISQALALGASPDFKAYGCSQSQLQDGQCFDPCISLRYGQGFFPGGKLQNLVSYTSIKSQNIKQPSNIRMVPLANYDKDGNIIDYDEQSNLDSNVYFRSPINTPHARIWRKLVKEGNINIPTGQQIVGISACQDGGSDHCNYLTPTIHLDSTSVILTNTSAFNIAQIYAANVFSNYSIGENAEDD